MRASLRRPGETVDCYRVWAEGQILRIDAGGSWDIAAAQAYTSDITQIVAEMRQICPHLRVIVDRSTVPQFQPGVPERLMATYNDILREGDRVAIIVDSSMAKSDIRRRAGREETEMFLSLSAAQTWLLAYG